MKFRPFDKVDEIEHVQFVSTLSKESDVRLVSFDNAASTLLLL